jgi:hypothetical protein
LVLNVSSSWCIKLPHTVVNDIKNRSLWWIPLTPVYVWKYTCMQTYIWIFSFLSIISSWYSDIKEVHTSNL